ncbi:MAG: Gfo/Idh/MocA family oxidoreductase [Actinomycetota bacterium]
MRTEAAPDIDGLLTTVPPAERLRVVRGRIDVDAADGLHRHAAAGGVVLVAPEPDDACGAGLAGIEVIADLPRTEWFVTLAPRPEAVRLEGEVPISSALRLLRPARDGVEIAATTSVRFEHSPTITVRRIGEGAVVASGVADLDALARHTTLGPFVRRLLDGVEERTDELGVAVVGYGPFGGMGYAHGLACTETDGLRLAAAVDTAPDRLEAARRDFPDLATYDAASQVAEDGDVDIAIVATPPVHHADLAIELLRAGKHVVVEKPMCLTVDDADRMLATAAEHDRTLTVHQSRRWDTDYLALRDAIGRGLLGEVFNVETFVGGFDHPCRAWHSEDSISGGAVYDWGSHHIDWILRLYGEAPARVLSTSHTRVWHDTTNVDQLSVWMQWADGREATFRQSDVAARRRPKFYVQGTEGTVEGHYRPLRTETVEPGRGFVGSWSHHAEAPVDLVLGRYEGAGEVVERTIAPAAHPGWGFHRNLADHLLLGEALAVPPQQSREVVAVLEAAHRSGTGPAAIVELD